MAATYKGHPVGLQDACDQLNQYITEHKLQSITAGYNVTKKTDMLSPGNTEDRCICGNQPKHLVENDIIQICKRAGCFI